VIAAFYNAVINTGRFPTRIGGSSIGEEFHRYGLYIVILGEACVDISASYREREREREGERVQGGETRK
jgi:hypothetical protein